MKPLGTGDPVRLGPYRLLGVLGEGGMGKVYVGQDGAGVLAAVKVLRPELAHDTDLAQRFVREAQAAQAVRSKGVAAVLGAHTEGARPWIATEFLAGPTLDQVVDTYGPLAEPALRALATSLALTLADIHAAGFVHRDLKPPNIVLTSNGPRVIDFGIARPEHGLTLTTTGQIPVTPGYGAPEQVLGRRVAPPADVFSLGALLVYAATGRRAFDGGHVAALQYEVVHGEPRLGDMPPQLQELIAPCLAKDPAARPLPAQIAQAMSAPRGADRAWRRGKIADAIKKREAEAYRLTTQITAHSTVGAPSVGRRRLLVGLSTAGVVVAAGGGTTAWWLGTRGGTTSRTIKKSDPFDIPPAVRTPVQPLDPDPDKDPSRTGQPASIWSLGDLADVYSPLLLPVRDVLVFGAASGGIAAYDVRDGRKRWTAPGMVAKAGYLSLSDRLVAGADSQGVLRTFVPSTGEPKWTCPGAEAMTLLGADAEAVYVLTKEGRVRSIGRADAKVRWTATVPADFRQKVIPPGAVGQGRVIIPASNGSVLALRTSDGRTVWSRTAHLSSDDFTVRPAADGDTVYLNGKTLEARRLSDGQITWAAKPGDEDGFGAPAVSTDAVYATRGSYLTRRDKRDGSDMWTPERLGVYSSPMTALTHSRVVLSGHGVWALDNGYSETDPMELKTAKATDGSQGWAYDVDQFTYGHLASAANRVFLMHDSGVQALTTF
ncbi:serine/threonine protein kinase [Streptomyces puniciscabiei]|uniref:Serine/threonine protein kinase n=1 Tax=Streptomyces puniciscabiei TaxID=164348 RepID=A0A542UAM3_9ACTN|nr:serine/threonine-protein kinase [Streptomyces puniciscabiei]TQK96126.1 serine/threonine protein kinase [Streptomyces puniciscabiei]